MTEPGRLEYESEKYGTVCTFLEYSKRREQYELTVFLRLPVHLYDFVDYQCSGKHTTHHGDGRMSEGYHEERVGETIFTGPRNMRLDFELDGPDVTPELVDRLIDEEFRDAIENYDGVVHFEKIIGVKS